MYDAEIESLTANWGATGVGTLFIVFYATLDNTAFQNIMIGNAGTDHRLGDNTSSQIYFQQEGTTRATDSWATGFHIIRIEYRASETRIFIDGSDITSDASSTEKIGANIWIGGRPFWALGSKSPHYFGLVAYSDGLITGSDADACEAAWRARFEP